MPAKSSSLGRGLNSLIPQKNSDNQSDAADGALSKKSASAGKPDAVAVLPGNTHEEGVYRLVPPAAVEANPYQPRVHFDEAALDELADSIKEHGMLQPVVVSEAGRGKYQIIMGERRLRAAERAGLREVPVIIRPADDREKLELALVENIVRENLNPIELAHAYQRYLEEFSLTHEAAAARLGKSRSVISNTIRLLQLPQEIQTALTNGTLSDAHAKIILGLPTPAQQVACFKQVVERNLTVARTRLAIQKMGGTKEARIKNEARDDEMEKKLRAYLGTRVSIQRAGGRGKIIVEFFNYDEMMDIVAKILEESA